MGFPRSYFERQTGDPAPLIVSCERRVRFEEIDVLGMVWHGRYASYFEDGRIAFGDSYGLSYQSFSENKTMAPVVQLHLDFKLPLRFDEKITIETSLFWSDSVRLNFAYSIMSQAGHLAASGYTVQLLTDPAGAVLLVAPDWLETFKIKWREGSLHK